MSGRLRLAGDNRRVADGRCRLAQRLWRRSGPNRHNLLWFSRLRLTCRDFLGGLSFATIILGGAELGDGAVPGALGRGNVSQDRAHVAAEEMYVDGSGVAEGTGLVQPGALQTPPALGDFVDQQLFRFAHGGVILVQFETQSFKCFLVLGGQHNDLRRRESMPNSVISGDLLTRLGTRASRALRVSTDSLEFVQLMPWLFSYSHCPGRRCECRRCEEEGWAVSSWERLSNAGQKIVG